MDQHLISVDELRAAGALDVPPEWRKSLGGDKSRNGNNQRSLFSDLIDDDNTESSKQLPASTNPNLDTSAD